MHSSTGCFLLEVFPLRWAIDALGSDYDGLSSALHGSASVKQSTLTLVLLRVGPLCP